MPTPEQSEPTGRVAAIVVNPIKVNLARVRAAVAAQEQLSGWEASRWYETTVDDAGGEVTAAALAEHPTIVVVAGGDGTVRVVAEAMHGSRVPLALLPSGTGNLLARNLGMRASDLAEAVRIAFEGAERGVDVVAAEFTRADGSVDSHRYVVMAGIGLDANMAVNTSAGLKKRVGWLAYTAPIASSVIQNKQVKMTYSVDGGRSRSVRAQTVIAGNCGTLTANILLLPDAVLDDGLLDVVLLRPRGFGGWARVGTRLATHGILHRSVLGRVIMRRTPHLKTLQYVQAQRLEVRFDEPEFVELDGDSFGEVSEVSLRVEPGALQVRVAGS